MVVFRSPRPPPAAHSGLLGEGPFEQQDGLAEAILVAQETGGQPVEAMLHLLPTRAFLQLLTAL
jgi:hypothetical protein